jgi:hypothetical protein
MMINGVPSNESMKESLKWHYGHCPEDDPFQIMTVVAPEWDGE